MPGGRPREGTRISIRVPDATLRAVDAVARQHQVSRAAAVRQLLADGVDARRDQGVDLAQVRRMLAMTPLERLRHMRDVAAVMTPLRGRARR